MAQVTLIELDEISCAVSIAAKSKSWDAWPYAPGLPNQTGCSLPHTSRWCFPKTRLASVYYTSNSALHLHGAMCSGFQAPCLKTATHSTWWRPGLCGRWQTQHWPQHQCRTWYSQCLKHWSLTSCTALSGGRQPGGRSRQGGRPTQPWWLGRTGSTACKPKQPVINIYHETARLVCR